MSEDGIEKLRLGNYGEGRLYVEFQKFLVSLYYQGIIIAVCSKNDYVDVINVFLKHSSMIIKENHVACLCANWDDKLQNLCLISQKLGIGLDSLVFADDSEFEIESVNMLLPHVHTIRFDKNDIYRDFDVFNISCPLTSDIRTRHEIYKTNV